MPSTITVLSGLAALRGDEDVARELARAAAALESVPANERGAFLKALSTSDRSEDAQVADDTIHRVLSEGADAVIADARARLAPDLARLLGVPGVTLDDVLAVHRRTGAVTAGDLAAAVGTLGHPASDIDDDLVRRLEVALPALRAGHPRIPLGRAVGILERVRDQLRESVPGLFQIEFSGSARRFEPTVGDLELIGTSADAAAALFEIESALVHSTVLHRGTRVLSVQMDGDPVTIRVVPPDEFPFAQVFYSGSAAHVRRLEALARAKGWNLSAAALTSVGQTTAPACETEADVYAALELAYVPPELRHGEDELAEAAAGRVPSLVTKSDIRGDLHVHTLWSDGRDSVETVVRAARALGYEYVAITDHSPTAAASRVLTRDRLLRQMEDVAVARKRFPGITVLQGVEVDILPDGSLDFDNDVLEQLDIVLASLHEPAGQSPDRLLERYQRAMEHPRVHVITHPSNRLVGRDDGYPLDYDALFQMAVSTGTVLEIDGGPAHLDMDGQLARRAIMAGVLVSIDSDCHNASRLERQMALGIGTARRGGVRAQDVLNTRPVDRVLAHFACKPARLADR